MNLGIIVPPSEFCFILSFNITSLRDSIKSQLLLLTSSLCLPLHPESSFYNIKELLCHNFGPLECIVIEVDTYNLQG